MKGLQVQTLRKIKVEKNTTAKKNTDIWFRIKDAITGEILHTGQEAYIRGVAKRKYNHLVVKG